MRNRSIYSVNVLVFFAIRETLLCMLRTHIVAINLIARYSSSLW